VLSGNVGSDPFCALIQPPADVEYLCLDGDVERRCRLVRKEKFRAFDESRRNGRALAHASREFMGIEAYHVLGIGHAHSTEALADQRPCFPAAGLPMEQQRLSYLDADAHDRIERCQRVLENHADPLAADLRQAFAARADQFFAPEPDRPSYHPRPCW
jgi:hypothetical protein